MRTSVRARIPELWAQGVGASGDSKGMVVDSSGALMPRANRIATETAKGVRRVASTDGSGSFLITGLEPAPYDVSVQMTGFATEIRKGVAVAIGQTVTLDFRSEERRVGKECRSR